MPISFPEHHRILKYVWFALGLALAGLIYYPVGNLPLRALLALVFVAWVAVALKLFWTRKPVRYGLIGLVAVAGLFLVAPGRAYDVENLREAYVAGLIRYEGTRYWWGGENRNGIDCSGLARRALIDADLTQGFKTVNPRLARMGLWLWWHDTTARGLRDGRYGLTRPVTPAPSINALTPDRLRPGDVAVAGDGIHCLIYLGVAVWIEAESDLGRVVTVRAPSATGWFTSPVQVVRWRQLETQ